MPTPAQHLAARIDENRRQLAEARVLIATASHEAFRVAKERHDWRHFVRTMRPLSEAYKDFYSPRWKRRAHAVVVRLRSIARRAVPMRGRR